MNLDVSYRELINLFVTLAARIRYVEANDHFDLFVFDTPFIYRAVVYKQNTEVFGVDLEAELSNQTDFETNFMATALLISKPKLPDPEII